MLKTIITITGFLTFHRRVPWLFDCSAESSNWQEWLRPELTYSNLLMWPRLPYPTLGRSQRHCSAYTPDIADTMQHRTPSIQRRPCADATKGNRENQTHLYKEHPHWRPEADPLPPPHSVCVLTLFLSACDFYCTYFSTVLDPVSLCELQRGIGCSLCTISWWRYWLAVEQDKLCPASAARLWPFLRQRALTLDSELLSLQSCLQRFPTAALPPQKQNTHTDTQASEKKILRCLHSRFSQFHRLCSPLLTPPPVLYWSEFLLLMSYIMEPQDQGQNMRVMLSRFTDTELSSSIDSVAQYDSKMRQH